MGWGGGGEGRSEHMEDCMSDTGSRSASDGCDLYGADIEFMLLLINHRNARFEIRQNVFKNGEDHSTEDAVPYRGRKQMPMNAKNVEKRNQT